MIYRICTVLQTVHPKTSKKTRPIVQAVAEGCQVRIEASTQRCDVRHQ